jgi:uncharacterized protein YcbK (DUF882 family)
MARPAWWDDIKYFKPEEFDSPDVPGSGEKYMKASIVEALEFLRTICQFPFKVNSGYRTPAHNRQVGGKPSSAHLLGYAADIAIEDSDKRYRLVKAALAYDIKRIGIARTFIHLDMAPGLPAPVIWLY